MMWIKSDDNTWMVRLNDSLQVDHFGLDSEGTGREHTNLLVSPVAISCGGKEMHAQNGESDDKKVVVCYKIKRGILIWTVIKKQKEMVWEIRYDADDEITDLAVTIPFNPLLAAAVVLPGGLDGENNALAPWLLVVPDYGHLLVKVKSTYKWIAVQDGYRGGSPTNAPEDGVDPFLRGDAWLEAAGRDYTCGKLNLRLCCKETIKPGVVATFSCLTESLQQPRGIDHETWKSIRRPYLNVWQPNSSWFGQKAMMVLSNNVLSDPASCSLYFYSEPMLFWHEPVKGIDLRTLLKRSLDFYLDNYVSPMGHMIAFGMHDLYVVTGAHFLVSAWDYWKISGDTDWLQQRIGKLHLVADFLVRRDQDKDGIIESINCGNSCTLREPDRADVWWEMVNFGWKNAWTNAHSYRAFLCLAEMLDVCGKPKGAAYYRNLSARLKDAFIPTFYNEKTGWFAGWISQDGVMHDYCYTPINGTAVAYGLVSPEKGREVLLRIIDRMNSTGFCSWHLGVPLNLIPIHPDDMIHAPVNLDGEPEKNHWGTDNIVQAGPDGSRSFGRRVYNGSISPCQTWHYLLALQVAGLEDEAGRILNRMIDTAKKGGFQNGILNRGYGGAEHLRWDGKTTGYEGYLSDTWVFLTTAFTRNAEMREKLLGPTMMK